MIEYIVAKSSHTRRCAGVPLWSLTSYAVSQASWGSKPRRVKLSKGGPVESRPMGVHMERVGQVYARPWYRTQVTNRRCAARPRCGRLVEGGRGVGISGMSDSQRD